MEGEEGISYPYHQRQTARPFAYPTRISPAVDPWVNLGLPWIGRKWTPVCPVRISAGPDSNRPSVDPVYFAPALLIILPLNLYFSKIGLYDSYFALIWVYQLITLPLLLWIVRGYFEDISPDIEYAYRLDGHSWFQSFWRISIPLAKPGIAAASLLCFIYAWNNFVFALILGSSQIQPVTVGALAFITASAIPYGLIACGIVVSVLPTLVLALFIQKYLFFLY